MPFMTHLRSYPPFLRYTIIKASRERSFSSLGRAQSRKPSHNKATSIGCNNLSYKHYAQSRRESGPYMTLSSTVISQKKLRFLANSILIRSSSCVPRGKMMPSTEAQNVAEQAMFSTKAQSIAKRPSLAQVLPADFMGKPLHEKPAISYVDWKAEGLDEFEGMYAVVIDGLFSRWECETLTAAAEASNGGEWDRAMVDAGGYQQELATELRNSGRIIADDEEIAARMWRRIAPHVPELAQFPLHNYDGKSKAHRVVKRSGKKYAVAGLNERLRFLRYGPGEYFRPHCDGHFVRPDGSGRSFYTLHLYLNEADQENPLEGGATSFHPYRGGQDVHIKPKNGRVLIFQHSYLAHSGQEVDRGLKLTLRTDLMYTRCEEDKRTIEAE